VPDSFDGYLYRFTFDEFGVKIVNDVVYEFDTNPATSNRLIITYQDIPAVIKQLNKMYDAWRHVPDID
jgi:hypothetical protein